MKKTMIAGWGCTLALTAGTLGVAATGAGSAVAATPAGPIAHATFDHPQQNPYFPLKPGTVFRYRGSEDGKKLVDTLTVTDRTRLIQGIRTTVILDVIRRPDGSLAEKTHDWYAPDDDGTVWYLGEATATYRRNGKVDSREGSWMAGRDGAVAGRIMPAHPRPAQAYRQEFYRGHAEDQAWIVANHESTTVPYGTVHDVVRSFEWTRLEKGVVSVKFYAPGLGIVREQDAAGGNELFELVSVTHR